jgi:hypothetical protein
MWDLTLITIFINHPLYVAFFFFFFSSSQYGIRVPTLPLFLCSSNSPFPLVLAEREIALEEARQEVESSPEDLTVEIKETPKYLKTILWKFFNMLDRTFSTNFHHTKSLRHPPILSPPTHLSQTQFSTKKSSFSKEAP